MKTIQCLTVSGIGTIIGNITNIEDIEDKIKIENPLLIGSTNNGEQINYILMPFLVMPEEESVSIMYNHLILAYEPNQELKEYYTKQVSAMKVAKSGIITPAQAKISNISDFKRK